MKIKVQVQSISRKKLTCRPFLSLAGRSITDAKEPVQCFTSYSISGIHHECLTDSDCDTYMICCRNQGEGLSVCVPYKGHVLPETKSRQSLSDGRSPSLKDYVKGHVFHLPQPSPIPLPILDESTYRKSWGEETITCVILILPTTSRSKPQLPPGVWNASKSNFLRVWVDYVYLCVRSLPPTYIRTIARTGWTQEVKSIPNLISSLQAEIFAWETTHWMKMINAVIFMKTCLVEINVIGQWKI